MHGGSETKSSIPFFKINLIWGLNKNIQLSLIKLKDKVIERQIDDDDDNEEIDF